MDNSVVKREVDDRIEEIDVEEWNIEDEPILGIPLSSALHSPPPPQIPDHFINPDVLLDSPEPNVDHTLNEELNTALVDAASLHTVHQNGVHPVLLLKDTSASTSSHADEVICLDASVNHSSVVSNEVPPVENTSVMSRQGTYVSDIVMLTSDDEETVPKSGISIIDQSILSLQQEPGLGIRASEDDTSYHYSTQSKTYSCPQCGKEFYYRSKLRVHLKKGHCKVKPKKLSTVKHKPGRYPCAECGKVFAHSPSLSRHRVKAHRSKGALGGRMGFQPAQAVHHASKSEAYDRCSGSNAHTSRPQTPVHETSFHSTMTEQLNKNSLPVEFSDGNSHIPEGHDGDPFPVQSENMSDKNYSVTSTPAGHGKVNRENIYTPDENHSAKNKEVSHKKEKDALCDVCGKAFKYPFQVRKHKLIHTEGSRLHCPICLKVFAHEASLKTHRMLHDGINPFQCRICGQIFSQISNMKRHELLHSGQKPHECPKCGKTFSQPWTLGTHLQTHNKKKFTCIYCKKVFPKYSSLKAHVAGHGKSKYKCLPCSKIFKNSSALEEHQLNFHSTPMLLNSVGDYSNLENQSNDLAVKDLLEEELTENESEYGKEMLIAEYFLEVPHLTVGDVLKKPPSRLECTICKKTFSHITTLRVHEAIHMLEGETIYKCNFCGKGFPYQSTLFSHKLSHSKPKSFECHYCKKSFVCAASLQKHTVIHENIKAPKDLMCHFCGKKFSADKFTTLKVHEARHTGVRPFLCTLCGSKFALESLLSKHQEEIHRVCSREQTQHL